MVVLIARYRAQPGRGDAVAEVLPKHVAATRQEKGCLQFEVTRSLDNREEFVLYEKYADEAALQAHRESKHFQQYILQEVVPMLEERTFQHYEEVKPG